MSAETFSGQWMMAIAEAAELAGAESLDQADPAVLERAWDLVARAMRVSQADLALGVAEQHHLEVADVAKGQADAARLVPGSVAWRRFVVPLAHSDSELVVATANPLSQAGKRELAGVSGRTVRFQIAPPRQIRATLKARYGPESEGAGGEEPSYEDEPGGPHVLVVDDEVGTRTLFRSVLEEHGFRVTAASDGPEALALLDADDSIELVTLDYWMNELNGLRVLQMMRQRPSLTDMPVIMVTGADNRAIEMSLFEAGVDDYITKPVDPPLLVLRVRAVLRRRHWS